MKLVVLAPTKSHGGQSGITTPEPSLLTIAVLEHQAIELLIAPVGR
ncbi:MAG: hypothetical protein JF606_03215 [Burkholderiales bacterium]|nr:hypothetical protein [Burkholderiales bacterium]